MRNIIRTINPLSVKLRENGNGVFRGNLNVRYELDGMEVGVVEVEVGVEETAPNLIFFPFE